MSTPGEPVPENSTTVTTIDDASVREACLGMARLIDALVQGDPCEPNGDPTHVDAMYKSLIFPAPLSYSHQLIRYYLEGVRDGLFAISQMFSRELHSHIPTAVLSRQIVEYSASAYYLANPEDSPEMRLAKMLSMYKPTLVRRDVNSEVVQDLYLEADRILRNWHSRAELPSASPPFGDITHAVAVLLSGFTEKKVSKNSYRRLSGFAHASPRYLTELYEVTWRNSMQMNAVRYAEAVGDIAVAMRSAFAAILRVHRLRVQFSVLDQKLLGIRIQHFGLVIDEITVRLGEFWNTVPQLMTEAYEARGMDAPRLEDLFKDDAAADEDVET